MYSGTKGFTLIELIVVIILLSTLAVVAAPRFLSLSADARVAKVEQAVSAIRSGIELVHARAVIDGAEQDAKGGGRVKLDLDLTGDGVPDIDLINGYPSPASITLPEQFSLWMNIDVTRDLNEEADFYLHSNQRGRVLIRLFDAPISNFKAGRLLSEDCGFSYEFTKVPKAPPLIQSNTLGCG